MRRKSLTSGGVRFTVTPNLTADRGFQADPIGFARDPPLRLHVAVVSLVVLQKWLIEVTRLSTAAVHA